MVWFSRKKEVNYHYFCRILFYECILGTTTAAPTPSTTVASKTESPKVKLGQIREGINCDIFSFYCPIDNRCIHDKWVCDGFIDCKDSYDEQPKFCNKKCKDSEFTCPDGTCIPESQKCDGNKDCPNGQDEMLPLCGKLRILNTSCFVFDMLVNCKSKFRIKKLDRFDRSSLIVLIVQIDRFMAV